MSPPRKDSARSEMGAAARGRYAMREALAVIGEDGLENLWEKHTRLHHELWAGLKEMGLEPFVENPAERLTTVNCIKARRGRLPALGRAGMAGCAGVWSVLGLLIAG